MPIEQSLDRLSGLIEQLVAQLELGRGGNQPATQPATRPATQPATAEKPVADPEPQKDEKPASSSGSTKTQPEPAAQPAAPSATGESTGLDFDKDVAPFAIRLAKVNRDGLVALTKELDPNAKRLGEIPPEKYAEALACIKVLLGED